MRDQVSSCGARVSYESLQGGISVVKAIVGANWGDEGKGKITDLMAEASDIVVRFQGGANAGHTIINDYGRFLRPYYQCHWKWRGLRHAKDYK